jgi:hypothetical protein
MRGYERNPFTLTVDGAASAAADERVRAGAQRRVTSVRSEYFDQLADLVGGSGCGCLTPQVAMPEVRPQGALPR